MFPCVVINSNHLLHRVGTSQAAFPFHLSKKTPTVETEMGDAQNHRDHVATTYTKKQNTKQNRDKKHTNSTHPTKNPKIPMGPRSTRKEKRGKGGTKVKTHEQKGGKGTEKKTKGIRASRKPQKKRKGKPKETGAGNSRNRRREQTLS